MSKIEDIAQKIVDLKKFSTATRTSTNRAQGTLLLPLTTDELVAVVRIVNEQLNGEGAR
jgi:hypothetical protein